MLGRVKTAGLKEIENKALYSYLRYFYNVMRKHITKLFFPKNYIGDFGLCLFLALLFYIIGVLFVFLSEINSAVTGAGIFTAYYVILFPIFLIPLVFLLFILLAINRYLKNKKKDVS